MALLKIISSTLLVLLSISTLHGQELVKKKKNEDGHTLSYFVLKNDKRIKQGAALTTHKNILGKINVVEVGQHEQNKKSGLWLSFYFLDPSNSLHSIGSYLNDQKEGHWKYYFQDSLSEKSVQAWFGAEKKTTIVQIKNDVQAFHIEYDTTNQQISSTGQYRGDKKNGIWNYYSRSGYLLHSYNHDSSKLLQNNLKDSLNDFLVYLGGTERFFNHFSLGQQRINAKFPITKTSEVIYEIEKNGNYKLLHFYGDENLKIKTEQILRTVPNEWILLNEKSIKKLHLISKILVKEDSLASFESLDLQVVN